MPAKIQNLPWLRKLKQNAQDDPKKAGFLTILCAVLVFLVIRQALKSSGSGPARSAGAGTTKVAKGKTTARATGNVAPITSQGAADAMRRWMLMPSQPLNRNLFSIKLDYFARDGSKLARNNKAVTGDSFWDEVAKSLSSDADQLRERQILVDNLRQQAGQLRLQTTIMGAEPKALINGELVGENSVVASFRVLKIEARRIIVEREGIKLEIQMK